MLTAAKISRTSTKAPPSDNHDVTRYRYLIWLLTGAFCSIYFVLLYERFVTYGNGEDFGLFMQSVSDPSGWLRNTVEGSHYVNHFSPIYELIVPLTIWTASVVPLMAVQAMAGTLVAPGLFEIGRRIMPAGLAFGTASVAFIYAPLACLICDDPYENVFAPATTVWLLFAVFRRQWLVAAVFVIVALAVKEDQAVFLAFGAFIGFSVGKRTSDKALQQFSVGVFVACVSTLGLYFVLIRPSTVGAAHVWPALAVAFHSTGNSSGLVGRLTYILWIFVPLAFLPLAAPRWLLLLLISPLAEITLAFNPIARTMWTHYAGVWIGYVLVAAMFGLAAVFRRSPDLARQLLKAAIALCMLSLLIAIATRSENRDYGQAEHYRDLDRFLATRLPLQDTTIGAPDVLYGHLWSRREAELGASQSPRYLVLDMNMKSLAFTRLMLRQIKTHEFGEYRPVWREHGVVLFVRASYVVPRGFEGALSPYRRLYTRELP